MGHITGLTLRIEREIGNWPVEREFMAAELVEMLGESMRSVARALAFLRRGGFVRVLREVDGPTGRIAVWVRTGSAASAPVKLTPMPAEHDGGVRRVKLKNGNTRVSFGKAWKPYRQTKGDRPWRGYQSSLASNFIA